MMLPFLRRAFLSTATATAVAFLGAIPLASAAGFYHGEDVQRGDTPTMVVFSSGAILFFLTLAVMGPLTRMGGSLASSLARSETRPAPPVALGLIVCGTLCVICSLWFSWSARVASSPEVMSNAVRQMEQSMANLKSQGFSNVNFSLPNPQFSTASSSSGPMILTVMAFFLGSSLIGIGVWSSFTPGIPEGLESDYSSNNHALKVPIPGADEARL